MAKASKGRKPATTIKVGSGAPTAGGAFQLVPAGSPESGEQKGKESAVPESLAADLRTLQAPEFYGSTIQAFFAGNDCSLVFSRTRPGLIRDGQAVAVLDPACTVHMSAATAKDLAILMTSVIGDYEKENGEIVTAYMKRRAAEKT